MLILELQCSIKSCIVELVWLAHDHNLIIRKFFFKEFSLYSSFLDPEIPWNLNLKIDSFSSWTFTLDSKAWIYASQNSKSWKTWVYITYMFCATYWFCLNKPKIFSFSNHNFSTFPLMCSNFFFLDYKTSLITSTIVVDQSRWSIVFKDGRLHFDPCCKK